MSKVLQEKGSRSLPGSTKTNSRDHVKSILTTVEADTHSIRRIEPPRYAVSSLLNRMQFFKRNQSVIPFLNRLINDSYEEMGELEELILPQINSKESVTNLKRLLKEMLRMGYQMKASMNVHDSTILEDSLPPKEKDLGIFTIRCHINNIFFEKALADLGASVSVSVMPYSTFTNLDMQEDIKVTLIPERPFLSTAHAKIDMFKRKITLRVGDDKIMFRSDNPTNNIFKRVYALGLRERMELDLEAMLLGETLILNRSLDLTYGDYIELNDLNEPLELRRNQVEDLGPTTEDGEVIDKLMVEIVKTRKDDEIIEGIDEYPSFCDFDRKIHVDCAYNLQFSCMIVVENMDVYQDQDKGEVIVGRLFCKDSCVEAIWFDGVITIHNDAFTTHILAHIRNMEDHTEQISGEFSALIL
ncbi:hypothetical protein Tco_0269317 [Tanacetum coccineum]